MQKYLKNSLICWYIVGTICTQRYNRESNTMTNQSTTDKEQARFAMRLDKDLHTAFMQVAKSNDQNPSQLVRQFMREYVKKNRQGNLF